MARENKATDYFKQTIRTYLERRAETDELFAERYADPKKNIDDCTTYILNQVEASGCHDFTDEDGIDRMKEVVQENYERIKAEASQIVAEELERIKNDPVLCKLLPEQQ